MKALKISALAASSLVYQPVQAINIAETEAVDPVEETFDASLDRETLAMPADPVPVVSAYCNITSTSVIQRWSVVDFDDNKTRYAQTILGL